MAPTGAAAAVAAVEVTPSPHRCFPGLVFDVSAARAISTGAWRRLRRRGRRVGGARGHRDDGRHGRMDGAVVGERPGFGKGEAERLAVVEKSTIPDAVQIPRCTGCCGVGRLVLLCPDDSIADLHGEILVAEVLNSSLNGFALDGWWCRCCGGG